MLDEEPEFETIAADDDEDGLFARNLKQKLRSPRDVEFESGKAKLHTLVLL